MRGGTTSGVATIKEREVGARFFEYDLQGSVEREECWDRGVDVMPGVQRQGYLCVVGEPHQDGNGTRLAWATSASSSNHMIPNNTSGIVY